MLSGDGGDRGPEPRAAWDATVEIAEHLHQRQTGVVLQRHRRLRPQLGSEIAVECGEEEEGGCGRREETTEKMSVAGAEETEGEGERENQPLP